MYLKTKILLFLVLSGYLPLAGQAVKTGNPPADQVLIRQVVADDLENQAKGVPLAAIRVLVNFRVASWLWKQGKDDTGRAAPLAVRALEELYQNKADIPDLYFTALSTDIFALLDSNDKELAKKLSVKYNRSPEDKLKGAEALLNQKGGEKIVTDKVVESLRSTGELSFMTTWLLDELRERNSPELQRLLGAILVREERGANNFTDKTLFTLADSFRSEVISNDLRLRFYRVVLNRGRNSLQTPDGDPGEAFDLLYTVFKDIKLNAPEMFAEAGLLRAALSTRVPNSVQKDREMYDRIEEALDRLSALMSEAERSDDSGTRNSLLTEAAQLAQKEGRFMLAVDLSEKVRANRREKEKDNKNFDRWYDQFLGEVSDSALKKSDIDSSKYAVRFIVDQVAIAENLRKHAAYYYSRHDTALASETIDSALKLLTNGDGDLRKVNGLIRLLPTAAKVDQSALSEVAVKTAKAINGLPSLKIDDKPGSEPYKQYVSTMMAVNYNLLPALRDLVNRNGNEAADFASRIDRKEIRIIADYVVLTDSIKAATPQTAILKEK